MAWKPTCGCTPWFSPDQGGFAGPHGLRSFAGSFTRPTIGPTGPALLLDLDFREPIVQPFPQSAAEMTALGLPAPTSIWDFREAAGNALDHVGAYDLTPVNAPWQNQHANGLWDGTDLYSIRCAEFWETSTSSFDAANNATFDYDTSTSLVISCVFRMSSWKSPAAYRNIFGKRDPVGTNNGYEVRIFSNGQVSLVVDGGAAQQVSTIASDHLDGAWHCVWMVLDQNTGNQTIYSDLGFDTDPLPAGNPSNTALFAYGSQRLGAASMQAAYGAAWLAAAAEAIGANVAAAHAAFWQYGGDSTGLLTTATHASALCCPIGDDTGDQGEVINDYAVDQLPIGWNGGFSHATELGLRSQSARSTLLTDSDDFTAAAWVPNNLNVSAAVANVNDSPRGMREACQLTATANNGYLQDLFVSLASTVYTFDVFVKRHSSMGADVPGALIMYDNTGAAIVTTQVFTATTEWQRVTLRAATNVGQVSTGFRIRIDNNTDSLAVFRATAVQGELTCPIFARGGVAAVALTDFRVAGVAGLYAHAERGEARALVICDANATTVPRVLFDLAVPGTNNNLRRAYYENNEQPRQYVYNAAGALQDSRQIGIQPLNVEHEHGLQWDAANPLAGSGSYARVLFDGTPYTGTSAAPYTWADLLTTVYVGSNRTPTRQLDGFLARLRVWEAPATGV